MPKPIPNIPAFEPIPFTPPTKVIPLFADAPSTPVMPALPTIPAAPPIKETVTHQLPASQPSVSAPQLPSVISPEILQMMQRQTSSAPLMQTPIPYMPPTTTVPLLAENGVAPGQWPAGIPGFPAMQPTQPAQPQPMPFQPARPVQFQPAQLPAQFQPAQPPQLFPQPLMHVPQPSDWEDELDKLMGTVDFDSEDLKQAMFMTMDRNLDDISLEELMDEI